MEQRVQIGEIPTIVWGAPSEAVYLYVHGKHGRKEDARDFAALAQSKGYQVLSMDLPEHGERAQERHRFNPWCVVPELHAVLAWAQQRWRALHLRADSIGAWFSMLSYAHAALAGCLFVSPILDMEQLIRAMMAQASVSEEDLRRTQEIPTDFGETLSWQYLDYARAHPIRHWPHPTAILCADEDALTPRGTVERFAAQYGCALTVLPGAEHWFHTPEQLEALRRWTQAAVQSLVI